MRRRALDQIGCDVGHDMQADRQLLQLAGNLRGAAVRRLRQRDHDLVDTAGASGLDQIGEPAAERQALRLQSMGTGDRRTRRRRS
jgi:glycerate kinase